MATSRSQTIDPVGCATDIGKVREHNEDSMLVQNSLYVVCDGMGGHQAGEVASAIAVQTLSRLAPTYPDASKLERAVEEANLAIIRAVEQGIGREGMGTTCTAAMLDGERLVIAQVGDSRAYLLHAGRLQQITRDHSLVADLIEHGEITPQDARNHPWRSYITRALGLDPRVQADLYELNVSAGDRLMLCSDGLYAMIEDTLIERILATSATPQAAADALVRAANDAGGSDNITVVVVDASGNTERHIRKLARKTKITIGVIVGILIAIAIACAVAINVLATNTTYLGEVDGKVAIYKGLPGDVAGISFSSLVDVTDVEVADLLPGTARRVSAQEIRCDSLDDAMSLVEGYRRDIQSRENGGAPDDADANPNATPEGAVAPNDANASANDSSASAATDGNMR